MSNIGVAVSYPSNKPSGDYAQLYHFDLDRIKWLKFFVYLTDVNENDGPHCYIEGTHKVFSKPYKLIKKGYKRINDDEIFSYFDKKKERKLTGKKGTIFVGDSSAFHKGLNPKENLRVMLSIEYCNSLFGAKVDKVPIDNLEKINISKDEFKTYKLFSRFI
mgnify:CR=1 FL=1